jgi:CubicO group peptidase (beta-lactamase class C family)
VTTTLSLPDPRNAALTRRTVLKAAGLGGLALWGFGLPRFALGQGVGGGWTHMVGGGGGLLFYNAQSGAAIVGTLDQNGFVQTESHDDFAPGINLVVCTSQGSVLYIDTSTGSGGTGTITGGYWTAANGYDGFASNWTHAVASADSVLLYDANGGQGMSGTLINGEWTSLFDYTDFTTGFTHLFASDDTLLFYDESSGLDATGTLTGGGWQFTYEYDSFAPGYGAGMAGGDSLLLVADGGGPGLAGTLSGGAWSYGGDYDGFGAWTHGASAGNGYAALYDANSGAGVWGTLAGGVWSYMADLAGATTDYGNGETPPDNGNAEAPPDEGNDGNAEPPTDEGSGNSSTDEGNASVDEATPDEGNSSNGTHETVTGPSGDGPTGVDQTGLLDSPTLDQFAQDAIAAANVPGLSVAIAKDGRLIFAKGYGVADRSTGDPITTGSRFRIASVIKPLTAAAVLALVEQGRLNLSDHVFGDGALLGTAYGSTPYADNLTRITITYLLEHTAGGWSNDGQDPMFQELSLSAIDLISWTLTNRPLEHEPGTHYAYSNFGYCILGRVIEQVTGKTYADAVQELILGPAGVTSMQIAGNTLADRATNEVAYDGSASTAGGTDPYGINVARMDSHGGWIATPVDVLRFAERVDGFSTVADLLTPGTIARMTTPSPANPIDRDPGYGMGWNVNALGIWWHRGNLPGTEAFLVRAADGHDWMAVANGSGIDLESLGWKMVDAITDTPPGQPL